MRQDDLIAAALAGGALGIMFGYWAYKTGGAQFQVTFVAWLTNPNLGGPAGVALFAGLGAIAGVGLTYLFRHKSN